MLLVLKFLIWLIPISLCFLENSVPAPKNKQWWFIRNIWPDPAIGRVMSNTSALVGDGISKAFEMLLEARLAQILTEYTQLRKHTPDILISDSYLRRGTFPQGLFRGSRRRDNLVEESGS